MHTANCSGQYCGICDCGGTDREAMAFEELCKREHSKRRWAAWKALEKHLQKKRRGARLVMTFET